MTNDLIPKNDEHRPSNLSETERKIDTSPRVSEFGASIDDRITQAMDVDAYYGKKTILFTTGRRRRSYGIL